MSPKYSDTFKAKNDKLVPGPGTYEFHLKALKTAPNYGIGTSKRMDPSRTNKTKGIETDPGAYDPTTKFTKTASPNFGFGTQQRKMYDDKLSKSIPGPGNYTILKGALGKRGVLMGEKLKSLSNLNVPGAGSYQPDHSPTKQQNPRFSMGIKLKSELSSKLKVPGPGSYVNKSEKWRQSAPSFGFGTSKRPQLGANKHQETPGPGNYRVNCKISNLAEYAMPGRSDDVKFV